MESPTPQDDWRDNCRSLLSDAWQFALACADMVRGVYRAGVQRAELPEIPPPPPAAIDLFLK